MTKWIDEFALTYIENMTIGELINTGIVPNIVDNPANVVSKKAI